MSSLKATRNWDPNKMYDVSFEERRAIEERAKMRNELKLEWQKKVTSPHRGVGGYIFDPAVQRFLSMRSTYIDQFKATPKNAAFAFAVCGAPILFFWWRVAKDKRELEEKCRTGQIAYKDRLWKNI